MKKGSKQNQIRQKTAREKELETKPACLWDPLKGGWCDNDKYPPTKEQCDACLIESIVAALKYEQYSETMRYFIGYIHFTKENQK